MAVVFDEVLTQVETPPERSETQTEHSVEAQSPQHESLRWQRQQAFFWRRQQRLEAD